MYQTDIDNSVDWAINNLKGRVTDSAGNYAGECLSLIKREYSHRTGEDAPAAGGWADGYLKLPGNLGHWFNNPERFDRNRTYPKGSYVINSPTHHIAIYLGRSGNNVSVFEQNADPDGSAAAVKTRGGDRIDWILTPRVTTPPVAPVHPYTIELIAPKQVKINKEAHKWGLNYDNLAAIVANPEGTVPAGTILDVRAVLHHNLNMSYYLEDASVASGFNVKDCDDYTAPVPIPVQTPPVIQPAPAPAPPPLPPAAPVPIPTSTDPYQVIKTLMAFTSSNNAINHTNAVGTVQPGKYMVYNRRNGMGNTPLALNVTKKAGTPGSWIRVSDNVEDPPEVIEPEPVVVPDTTPVEVPKTGTVIPTAPSVNPNKWKTTNQPLLPNFGAVKVITNNEDPVTIHDYDDPANRRLDITLEPFKELHIVSVFQKDGVTYARPAGAAKQFKWYGVPWELVSEEQRKLSFADTIGQILTNLKLLIQDVKKYK